MSYDHISRIKYCAKRAQVVYAEEKQLQREFGESKQGCDFHCTDAGLAGPCVHPKQPHKNKEGNCRLDICPMR